jgi:hypothetical protein
MRFALARRTHARQGRTHHFDPETVTLLREVLANAWACLQPAQQAATSQSVLAERILKAAARGERDPGRLVEAALDELSIEQV